jgi:hypothetical protein
MAPADDQVTVGGISYECKAEGTHLCYHRNKNGQITGPENEHLTPSRGLTSASERRKPLFLRLPGVFLR